MHAAVSSPATHQDPIEGQGYDSLVEGNGYGSNAPPSATDVQVAFVQKYLFNTMQWVGMHTVPTKLLLANELDAKAARQFLRCGTVKRQQRLSHTSPSQAFPLLLGLGSAVFEGRPSPSDQVTASVWALVQEVLSDTGTSQARKEHVLLGSLWAMHALKAVQLHEAAQLVADYGCFHRLDWLHMAALVMADASAASSPSWPASVVASVRQWAQQAADRLGAVVTEPDPARWPFRVPPNDVPQRNLQAECEQWGMPVGALWLPGNDHTPRTALALHMLGARNQALAAALIKYGCIKADTRSRWLGSLLLRGPSTVAVDAAGAVGNQVTWGQQGHVSLEGVQVVGGWERDPQGEAWSQAALMQAAAYLNMAAAGWQGVGSPASTLARWLPLYMAPHTAPAAETLVMLGACHLVLGLHHYVGRGTHNVPPAAYAQLASCAHHWVCAKLQHSPSSSTPPSLRMSEQQQQALQAVAGQLSEASQLPSTQRTKKAAAVKQAAHMVAAGQRSSQGSGTKRVKKTFEQVQEQVQLLQAAANAAHAESQAAVKAAELAAASADSMAKAAAAAAEAAAFIRDKASTAAAARAQRASKAAQQDAEGRAKAAAKKAAKAEKAAQKLEAARQKAEQAAAKSKQR